MNLGLAVIGDDALSPIYSVESLLDYRLNYYTVRGGG